MLLFLRYAVFVQCRLDTGGGESVYQSGWCEQACPDRLTRGDMWFLGGRARRGRWQRVVKPSAA